MEKILKKCSEDVFDFSELEMNDGCAPLVARSVRHGFSYHSLVLAGNCFSSESHITIFRELPANSNLTRVGLSAGPLLHHPQRRRHGLPFRNAY